jgi:hypothetical protein
MQASKQDSKMQPKQDLRSLRDIILDQCEVKELRIEDVVKKTGMPEQYLDAIINTVRTRLPAFPYIRVYLIRLAALLGIEQGLLLAKYKAEFSDKISGQGDTLPGNRFALRGGWRRYASLGSVIVGLIIVYGVSRSGMFRSPLLTIDNPPLGKEPFSIVSTASITLSGSIEPGDTLTINGQPLAPQQDGRFTREYQLAPELNIIEFKVKRFLGGEVEATRQVYYDKPSSTPATVLKKERPATLESVENSAKPAAAASSTP